MVILVSSMFTQITSLIPITKHYRVSGTNLNISHTQNRERNGEKLSRQPPFISKSHAASTKTDKCETFWEK